MRWYARPESESLQLRVQPQLWSMNKNDDPEQVRLQAYLNDTVDLLAASQIDGPWALRLDVGRPASRNLLDKADLDNYAFPLADRLRNTGLVSVWATKQYGEQSFVRIAPATEVPPPSIEVLRARTTVSYQRREYKEQIHAVAAAAAELPDGAVRLELAFVIGYDTRNWPVLWKPTIDALEPLLGHDPTAKRPWNPRDGRITELGMHLSIDPALRHDVVIGIAAAPAP